MKSSTLIVLGVLLLLVTLIVGSRLQAAVGGDYVLFRYREGHWKVWEWDLECHEFRNEYIYQVTIPCSDFDGREVIGSSRNMCDGAIIQAMLGAMVCV